jgi:thiamine pyrophosphate-dependent acetolactate synthase large subunit-like protein
VSELFTLCGGHISPILVACESLGIRVYDTRHEATAGRFYSFVDLKMGK